MEIQKVKIIENGYLVNGVMTVPNSKENRLLPHVERWLEENTPEPEITEQEQHLKDTIEWKSQREKLVSSIEVSLDGVVFQGDEISQNRMSNAINGLPDESTTIDWVAKDNTVHQLNKANLKRLLFLAGTEQSEIWNFGRPTQ